MDDEDGTVRFAQFVMSRDWHFPENVVLIMQPEEGGTKVFRPKGYRLSVAPDAEKPHEEPVRQGPPDLRRWA